MGYTTEFMGAVKLSRKLTLKEAREWLTMSLEGDAECIKWKGKNLSYLQWVPSETLDELVWDQNEKFYDYVQLLEFILEWLEEKEILANGELIWSGENTDDNGKITVVNSKIHVAKNNEEKISSAKPLTSKFLADMALDLVAK